MIELDPSADTMLRVPEFARPGQPLSERELDVLRLIADGCSNREIGDRLHYAEGTIKMHVRAVIAKLASRDRTAAAVRAVRLGII